MCGDQNERNFQKLYWFDVINSIECRIRYSDAEDEKGMVEKWDPGTSVTPDPQGLSGTSGMPKIL